MVAVYAHSHAQIMTLRIFDMYNFVMRWSIFTFSGWVNTLLSWKGIIPLSRLTYTAYLVHPVVMETYYLSRRNLIEFSDIEAVTLTYTQNLLEAPVC